MAERRMFAKSLVESDLFMDLEAACQALYFHLALQADDEGFINAPRRVLRMLGAGAQTLRMLVDSGLVLEFDSGVLLIRHWLVHNKIRADRLRGTLCRAEREQVEVDGSGEYVLKAAAEEGGAADGGRQVAAPTGDDEGAAGKSAIPQSPAATAPFTQGGLCLRSDEGAAECQAVDNQVATKWQPNDNQVAADCPHRIGKDRIGKVSIGEGRENAADFVAAPSDAPAAPPVPLAPPMPPAPSEREILEIFQSYGQICTGLLPCKKLTQQRRGLVHQVLKKRSKEEILGLLHKAQNSGFLKGKNPRHWVAGFDWLFQEGHFDRLDEGNYDDCDGTEDRTVPTGGHGLGDAELEAVYMMMGME